MGRTLAATVDQVEGTELLATEFAGAPRPDFKIFTRGMEILRSADGEEGDGKRRIRCIASSSVKDLHGDTMTAHCVRSMAKQAQGLTIFLNHSYRAPEDVFGTVEKARTKTVSASEAKSKGWIERSAPDADVVLLQLDVALSKGQRIDETYTHIENGVTLGVSIGANITDYEQDPEYDGESWWPPLIINDVDLLEASIVGIPANPLSWVEGATKGLIVKGAVPGVNESTFQRARRLATKAAADDGWEDPNVTKKAEKAEPVAPQADPETDESKQDDPPFVADGPEQIVAHFQIQVEKGLASRVDQDAMEASVQEAIDLALNNGVEASAFEGRTAVDLAKEILSAMPAEQVGEDTAAEKSAETPEGDQEAAAEASAPESGDAGSDEQAAKAAEEELAALRESGVLRSMSDMVETLEDLLRKLFETRSERDQLAQERDELLVRAETAELNFSTSMELVKKIMALPLARKSAPIEREIQEGISRLKGGPYSEEVLRILYPQREGDSE